MYNHENGEGHNSLLMQRSYCSQIKLLQSFSQFFHKLLNLKDINNNNNNNTNDNNDDDDDDNLLLFVIVISIFTSLCCVEIESYSTNQQVLKLISDSLINDSCTLNTQQQNLSTPTNLCPQQQPPPRFPLKGTENTGSMSKADR